MNEIMMVNSELRELESQHRHYKEMIKKTRQRRRDNPKDYTLQTGILDGYIENEKQTYWKIQGLKKELGIEEKDVE